MIAHLQGTEWEYIWLTINRVVLFIGALWAFLVTLRIYKVDKEPGPRLGVVPTPVLFFSMFWSGSLGVYTAHLVLLDRVGISTGPERVFYAFSIAWTIFGLTWVLAIGGRAAHLGRMLEEVKRKAKEPADEGQ